MTPHFTAVLRRLLSNGAPNRKMLYHPSLLGSSRVNPEAGADSKQSRGGFEAKPGRIRKPFFRKAGFTLIELTASVAILCLLSLFTLDSIMTYRRIAEENKCRLLADAYAWDILWKQFNRPFDHLQSTTDVTSLLTTLPAEEAARDLPDLSHDGRLPIHRYLRIQRDADTCTLTVNVYWQVAGKWRSLWEAGSDDPNAERVPYRLVRSYNSRTTE